MELLVRLLVGIAWPVVVVWIAYLFRRELRAVIGRISRVKYKDVEFEIGLSKAEANVKVIEQTFPLPKLAEQKLHSRLEQLRRIADVSPRAAIMEAWIWIEEAAGMSEFIQGAKTPLKNALSFVHWLVKTGKLPSESDDLVSELRNLRDHAAAHKNASLPAFELSKEDAGRYLELAAKASSMILGPNE